MVDRTYFVGDEIDAFVCSPSAYEDTGGAIGGFSRGSVMLPNQSAGQSYIDAYCVDETDGTRKGFAQVWTHFGARKGNTNNSQGTPLYVWYNNAGTPVVRVSCAASNFNNQAEYWNGASWVIFAANFPVNYFGNNDIFDLYVNVAVSGRVELFFRSVSLGFFAGNTTGFSDIARFRAVTSGADPIGVNQVIMANYNTIGHTVRRRNASAAGNYTAWGGAYTDINEYPNSDASQITSSTAGQKESFVAPALSATAGGSVVKCVAVAARVRADTSGPANLKPFLRSGGVDYNAPFNVVSPGFGYEGRVSVFSQDPSTSAAWASITAVNNTEMGLTSAA